MGVGGGLPPGAAVNILLVTGSRTIAGNAALERWVRESLHPRMTGATLVVAGDAAGADAIAHEMAQRRRVVSHRWCVSGEIQSRTRQFWFGGGTWADERTTKDPRKRPLERNAAMVANYAGMLHRGSTVRAVGFVDAASPTHGTDHTLRLCKRAGVPTERLVWETTADGGRRG